MYRNDLYRNIPSFEAHRRASETIGAISAHLVLPCGQEYFQKLVRYLAEYLNVRYAFLSEISWPHAWRARTISRWMGDRFGESVEYTLRDTPCYKVALGSSCFYPLAVQKLFPRDKDIIELNGESYLGVPVKNRTGRVIGHLAIMDIYPMENEDYLFLVTKHFANRISEQMECLQKSGPN